MFVIEVIPLASNAPLGTLSYRTANKVTPGTLVEVPLRKKTVLGIVVRIENVRDVRSTLRTAAYTLRRGNPKKVGTVPRALMQAAEEIARYHATTLGAVLGILLPKIVPKEGFGALKSGSGFEEYFVEMPRDERIAAYRDRAQATKGTLLIIAPTIVEVENLTKQCVSEHVVVALPSALFTPIEHLSGIVIERESAGGYVGMKRPYIDYRTAARALARAREVPLILGDYPLRIECRPNSAVPLVHADSGSAEILDVRTKKTEQKVAFTPVPERITADIKKVLDANGRALVIAVRRGYAPSVVCRDCGAAVKDERGRTLALVGTAGGKPVLRSPDGQTLQDAKALCDICASWNLMPLGVGIERVALELKKIFPSASVIRFDSESVKTPAQARRAMQAAAESGSILVATEAVLPWLASTTFDYAAIASADSLLALPFWRARERLVHLGLTLRQHAPRLVIATRRPDDPAFSTITNPKDAVFFEDETMLRKALSYPPFSMLIMLTYEGTKERVTAMGTRIGELLSSSKLVTLPPRLETKGRYRGTTIIKLPSDTWTDSALSEPLASLPPSVRVRINPESLL